MTTGQKNLDVVVEFCLGRIPRTHQKAYHHVHGVYHLYNGRYVQGIVVSLL